MGKRILLIELSATMRVATERLLSKSAYDVTVAASFSAALRAIEPAANNPHIFDAVVLGWPTKTDYDADELFSLLDQDPYRSLPVLVLAHEADTAKLNWVARRPVTALVAWQEYLESADSLKALLQKSAQDSACIKFPGGRPDSGIRVLFVDDSPTVRVTYRRLLTRNGYQTDTASGAEEALEKAVANHYDIAIVDYFMPESNGDELCRQLRENPRTSHITSAIITGTYLDKAIIDSLEAGAVECMFKNEGDELFLARIDAMSRGIRIMQTIEKDRKRLDGILSSVGDGVYGVDDQGAIAFINPAARDILGIGPSDPLIGVSAHSLFHHTRPDGAALPPEDCPLQKAYAEANQLRAQEAVFTHRDARQIPVECTIFPLRIEDKHEGSVVAFRDVSERKLMERELKWRATHDPLTKLPNRYYFEQQLGNEVKRLKRSDENSALLYLDLDRFKYLNDTAGHTAGDQLLIEVGHQLRCRLRESDILSRLGGDEFAIILRNIDPDIVYATAETFRQVLNDYTFFAGGKSYQISVSIGVALIDSESLSTGEILANADIACYIAKSKGRNHCHVFINDHDERATMDLELGWSARLRDALEEDLFVLHYQPIADLSVIENLEQLDHSGPIWTRVIHAEDSNIRGYEVLLRLKNVNGDLIPPEVFLPTAERFNMMRDIDRWVIRQAVAVLAQERIHDPGLRFSVNLSGQTLEDEHLAQYIYEIVKTYDVPADALTFEITETSAIANIEGAQRLMDSLRKLGCKFALDDFGCGFSSFSHLKLLDVDSIKIDGMFVQGMMNESIDRAIINSIVQIAHSAGMKTVAEYVENASILQQLRDAGVDYVQGYFISHPLSQVEPLADFARKGGSSLPWAG